MTVTSLDDGWSSHEAQVTRFDVILSHLPLRTYRTFLDVGCGHGHLADLIPSEYTYTGLDVSADAIAYCIAHQNNGSQSRTWAIGDVVTTPILQPNYDIVVASGVFAWSDYAPYSLLAALWEYTADKLIFNIRDEQQEAPELLTLITKFTNCYILQHNYLEDDSTVVMQRA